MNVFEYSKCGDDGLRVFVIARAESEVARDETVVGTNDVDGSDIAAA